MTQIDETMSQDTAFTDTNSNDNTFQFDDVKDTTPTDSQPETVETDTDSTTSEDKSDVSSEEEQKVPYSRFKKLVEERDATQSTIQKLEERLAELETKRNETTDDSDIVVPDEWKQLYGDSDVARQAFKVQLKREEQIQERAVQTAIERLQKNQEENAERLSENEQAIDDNLSSLSESLGKKFTEKQEEAILSIVDEFSPVGADGKYISMFPFDKAYEIYTLRSGAKANVTHKARVEVSDLTNTNSNGVEESSNVPFQRSWDGWRKEI